MYKFIDVGTVVKEGDAPTTIQVRTFVEENGRVLFRVSYPNRMWTTLAGIEVNGRAFGRTGASSVPLGKIAFLLEGS